MPETVYLSNDPTVIQVANLVKGVKQKTLALADIQRASVWDKKRAKQLDLFRSLYLGIPVGVLYIWEPSSDTRIRSRHFHGLENYYDSEKVEGLILDGQQRTTALCRLHFSRPMAQAHLMDRLVLTLSGDAKTEHVFRYEKNYHYTAKSNEVVIQKLMGNEGLTKEQHRITAADDLGADQKIDYINKMGRALESFTKRKIGVQYVNKNSNLNDALRIFSTVNQAGVALADQDFIQAILTSVYPEIHSKIYSLEESLQRVQTGLDKDDNPTYGTLSGFKRDILMKAILWELYGTTKRKAAIVNDNLCIYHPKSINKSLTKQWKNMSSEEKENVSVPLTKEKVKQVFDKISTAAKKFKDVLINELFFHNTTGHSDNSILGGIIYYVKDQYPSEENKGKLLLWYILSSYHLEWTGGSTDDKVNATCRAMSNISGADWESLWKQMQENSGVNKKSYSGNHKQLYPKLEQKEFPGIQSKTTGNSTGIIVQLLERSLPRIYRMRDWFTGEQLGHLKYREFSIHHIYPQSRFKNNSFTSALIAAGIQYSDTRDPERHAIIEPILSDVKRKISQQIVDIDCKILEVNESITKCEEEIVQLKADEDANSEEISSVKKLRKASMKRRNDLGRHKSIKVEELSEIDLAITDFDNAVVDDAKSNAIFSACEFWFSWSNKKILAMNHQANKVSIKRGTNSSIGNSWPEDYLATLLHHENRIQKQFIDLTDLGLFNCSRFVEFIESRSKLQHDKLSQFFSSLYQGNWTEGTDDGIIEPTIHDLLDDAAELLAERKSSVFYDFDRGDATWNLCKTAKKKINYLLHDIVRAVLAYGNSGGGYVIVGASDEGSIIGLDNDIRIISEKYATNKDGAKDKITLQITQELINCSQKFVKNCVKVKWYEVDGKDIIRIKIRGSNEAVLHKKYPKTQVDEENNVSIKEYKTNVHWIRLEGSTQEKNF